MFEIQPKHDFLVGIDSDGCAFDTMELKHKECFIPNTVDYFDLQGISKYAREAAEFVNLYSKSRGINRFPALVETLQWLQSRPEVKARGVQITTGQGAASILERVRRERGSAPLIGEFFRKPVLREVARTMSQPASDESLVRVRDAATVHDTAIAVVGMSGRFPGAKSVDELWENLLAGVDSITKSSNNRRMPSSTNRDRPLTA